MMFMLLLICVLSATFLFLNHPLSFGLILLIQSIIIALISGLMNYSFWFSYILFLIMIGGMLILFIYMTSIASNEKFNFSIKLTVFASIFLLTIASLSWMNMVTINDLEKLIDLAHQPITMNNTTSINKFMNYPSNMTLLTIISYLLITLIAVVKITEIKYGPLRQKF